MPTPEDVSDALTLARQLGAPPIIEGEDQYICPVPGCGKKITSRIRPTCPDHNIHMDLQVRQRTGEAAHQSRLPHIPRLLARSFNRRTSGQLGKPIINDGRFKLAVFFLHCFFNQKVGDSGIFR